ncbi:MAG: sigma-70 family RNA polymerase sigma factor [Bacteroidetes bacterium]|jgi:RNA polymerase sigma factor (sigma-70 family)|nr:sigma-70 family RNA polymerase sigma factor [Bacteroidota bacterium]MDA0879115.1 sigma-70 family RNA polymerase sigma factor [Bacteroidota bacterium]MDA1115579.1 sigma-70 family RNA polymerase sigma factor [Bacteroidota bacterium]
MYTNETTDAVLVSAFIKGDDLAIKLLIERHRSRIFNFIYSKVSNRDISEDIFQDTFLKVIRTVKSKRYNEEGKFVPWVMRIAHNLVIDHFRKQNRIPVQRNSSEFDVFSMISDSTLNAENKIIKDQVELDVVKLLDVLPNDQREVLEMRLFKDMSFKEISEQTGVSINTALGRMRYALINLRKAVDKFGIVLNN